jgi:hypothetical protein
MFLKHEVVVALCGKTVFAVAIPLALLVGLFPSISRADEPVRVTWEQQAERLQNVSAALLDSMPVSILPPNGLSVGAWGALSFLPEVNPRVGGKSEKVPSSPVHAVPQLQLAYGQSLAVVSVTGRLWAGYLPPGLEGLMGIDAELSQWTVGGAVGSTLPLPTPPFIGRPALELGLQTSGAKLTGAITEPKAKDKFTSSGRILYMSLGLQPKDFGLHAALVVATRKVDSTFVVSSSRTELSLVDELEDASFPMVLQGQLGWRFPLGITAGVAQLWVPSRLAMPRLFASYDHSL